MRDLTCCLSSISIHTLAAALIIATGVALPPDPGVTRGGVSISGALSTVAIDTRVELEMLPPPTHGISATNPFETVASDAVISTVVEPVVPTGQTPPARLRPASMNHLVDMAHPLWVLSAEELQPLGSGSSQSSEPVEPGQMQFDEVLTSGQGRKPASGAAAESTGRSSVSAAVPDSPDRTQEPGRNTADLQLAGKPQATGSVKQKRSAEPDTVESPVVTPPSVLESKTAVAHKQDPAVPTQPESPGATVDQPPKKLSTNPGPVYPRDAWERQQEGVVYLLVQVSGNGQADGVRIYRTSGFRLLDTAAEKTVRRWKFHPAMRGGKPVSSQVLVPIRFRIRRQ